MQHEVDGSVTSTSSRRLLLNTAPRPVASHALPEEASAHTYTPPAPGAAFPVSATSPRTPIATGMGTGYDSENPFVDFFAQQDLRAPASYSDLDELSHQSLGAFFADEPRGAAPSFGASTGTSEPWRIPPALVRKHSALPRSTSQNEGSPLRWSFSNASRGEENRSLDRDRQSSFVAARQLQSSVSLESLSSKLCVTPRRSSVSTHGNGAATAPIQCIDTSPLSCAKLHHLSRGHTARILKSDAQSVDPYMN